MEILCAMNSDYNNYFIILLYFICWFHFLLVTRRIRCCLRSIKFVLWFLCPLARIRESNFKCSPIWVSSQVLTNHRQTYKLYLWRVQHCGCFVFRTTTSVLPLFSLSPPSLRQRMFWLIFIFVVAEISWNYCVSISFGNHSPMPRRLWLSVCIWIRRFFANGHLTRHATE